MFLKLNKHIIQKSYLSLASELWYTKYLRQNLCAVLKVDKWFK